MSEGRSLGRVLSEIDSNCTMSSKDNQSIFKNTLRSKDLLSNQGVVKCLNHSVENIPKCEVNKTNVSSSPLGAYSDSDDDNDVTVALDMNEISATNKEEMYKLTSFQVPKYSEAEMAVVKEQMAADKASLQEAMSIADKLMERAISAENARAAAAQQHEEELQNAKQALQKEKDEGSIALAPMRALSHTLRALENEIKTLKATHAATMEAQSAEHEKTVASLRNKAEADKTEKAKRHAEILAISAEKTEYLQKELLKQKVEHEQAVADAKAKVYAKVKSQFEQGNKEFTKVKSANESLNKELANALSQVKAASAKISSSEDKCSKFSNKVSKLEKEGAELRSCKDALEVEVTQLRETLYQKEQKLTQVESKLDNYEEKIKSLQSELEEKGQSLQIGSSKVKALQEKLQTQDEMMASIKADSDTAKKERDSQMLAVAKLVTSNSELQSQLEQITSEKEDQEKRNSGLRKMNEEMMAMLEKVHGV